jgi:hypothetical protein
LDRSLLGVLGATFASFDWPPLAPIEPITVPSITSGSSPSMAIAPGSDRMAVSLQLSYCTSWPLVSFV